MRISERSFWAGALLLVAWSSFIGQESKTVALTLNPAAAIRYHDDPKVWYANPAGQMIFFAVLEGLYSDGVPNEVVDLIIPKGRFDDHFVYACPLCHPAYEAMRLYRQRNDFYGLKASRNTFGSGIAHGDAFDKLHSPDRAVRLHAIQGLIQDWVARRLSSLNLSEVQRGHMIELMEEGRKHGAEMLQKKNDAWPLKGCAICDGCVEGSKPPVRPLP